MSDPVKSTPAARMPNPNLVLVNGSGKKGFVSADLKSSRPEKSLQAAIDKMAPHIMDCGAIISTWGHQKRLADLVKEKVGSDVILGQMSNLVGPKNGAEHIVKSKSSNPNPASGFHSTPPPPVSQRYYGWTFCRVRNPVFVPHPHDE